MAICFTTRTNSIVFTFIVIFVTVFNCTELTDILDIARKDCKESLVANKFLQSIIDHKDDLEWIENLENVVDEIEHRNPHYVLKRQKRNVNRRHFARNFRNLLIKKFKNNSPYVRTGETMYDLSPEKKKNYLLSSQMDVSDMSNGMTGVLRKRGYKQQHVPREDNFEINADDEDKYLELKRLIKNSGLKGKINQKRHACSEEFKHEIKTGNNSYKLHPHLLKGTVVIFDENKTEKCSQQNDKFEKTNHSTEKTKEKSNYSKFDDKTRKETHKTKTTPKLSSKSSTEKEIAYYEPEKQEKVTHEPQKQETLCPESHKPEKVTHAPQKQEKVSHESHKQEKVTQAPQKQETLCHELNKQEKITHEPQKQEKVSHKPQKQEKISHKPQKVTHKPQKQEKNTHKPQKQEKGCHKPQKQEKVSHEPHKQEKVSHEPHNPEKVSHEPHKPEKVSHEPHKQEKVSHEPHKQEKVCHEEKSSNKESTKDQNEMNEIRKKNQLNANKKMTLEQKKEEELEKLKKNKDKQKERIEESKNKCFEKVKEKVEKIVEQGEEKEESTNKHFEEKDHIKPTEAIKHEMDEKLVEAKVKEKQTKEEQKAQICEEKAKCKEKVNEAKAKQKELDLNAKIIHKEKKIEKEEQKKEKGNNKEQNNTENEEEEETNDMKQRKKFEEECALNQEQKAKLKNEKKEEYQKKCANIIKHQEANKLNNEEKKEKTKSFSHFFKTQKDSKKKNEKHNKFSTKYGKNEVEIKTSDIYAPSRHIIDDPATDKEHIAEIERHKQKSSHKLIYSQHDPETEAENPNSTPKKHTGKSTTTTKKCPSSSKITSPKEKSSYSEEEITTIQTEPTVNIVKYSTRSEYSSFCSPIVLIISNKSIDVTQHKEKAINKKDIHTDKKPPTQHIKNKFDPSPPINMIHGNSQLLQTLKNEKTNSKHIVQQQQKLIEKLFETKQKKKQKISKNFLVEQPKQIYANFTTGNEQKERTLLIRSTKNEPPMTPQEIRNAKIEAKKLLNVDKDFNERNEPEDVNVLNNDLVTDYSDYNDYNLPTQEVIIMRPQPTKHLLKPKPKLLLYDYEDYDDITKKSLPKKRFLQNYKPKYVIERPPQKNYEYEEFKNHELPNLYSDYDNNFNQESSPKYSSNFKDYFFRKRSLLETDDYEFNDLTTNTEYTKTNDFNKKIKDFFGIGQEDNYNINPETDYMDENIQEKRKVSYNFEDVTESTDNSNFKQTVNPNDLSEINNKIYRSTNRNKFKRKHSHKTNDDDDEEYIDDDSNENCNKTGINTTPKNMEPVFVASPSNNSYWNSRIFRKFSEESTTYSPEKLKKEFQQLQDKQKFYQQKQQRLLQEIKELTSTTPAPIVTPTIQPSKLPEIKKQQNNFINNFMTPPKQQESYQPQPYKNHLFNNLFQADSNNYVDPKIIPTSNVLFAEESKTSINSLQPPKMLNNTRNKKYIENDEIPDIKLHSYKDIILQNKKKKKRLNKRKDKHYYEPIEIAPDDEDLDNRFPVDAEQKTIRLIQESAEKRNQLHAVPNISRFLPYPTKKLSHYKKLHPKLKKHRFLFKHKKLNYFDNVTKDITEDENEITNRKEEPKKLKNQRNILPPKRITKRYEHFSPYSNSTYEILLPEYSQHSSTTEFNFFVPFDDDTLKNVPEAKSPQVENSPLFKPKNKLKNRYNVLKSKLKKKITHKVKQEKSKEASSVNQESSSKLPKDSKQLKIVSKKDITQSNNDVNLPVSGKERDDIIQGIIPSKIIWSLFNEVKSQQNLKELIDPRLHIAPCGNPIPGIQCFKSEREHKMVEHVEASLRDVVLSLNQIVKEELSLKSCHHLDPTSQEFLEQIIENQKSFDPQEYQNMYTTPNNLPKQGVFSSENKLPYDNSDNNRKPPSITSCNHIETTKKLTTPSTTQEEQINQIISTNCNNSTNSPATTKTTTNKQNCDQTNKHPSNFFAKNKQMNLENHGNYYLNDSVIFPDQEDKIIFKPGNRNIRKRVTEDVERPENCNDLKNLKLNNPEEYDVLSTTVNDNEIKELLPKKEDLLQNNTCLNSSRINRDNKMMENHFWDNNIPVKYEKPDFCNQPAFWNIDNTLDDITDKRQQIRKIMHLFVKLPKKDRQKYCELYQYFHSKNLFLARIANELEKCQSSHFAQQTTCHPRLKRILKRYLTEQNDPLIKGKRSNKKVGTFLNRLFHERKEKKNNKKWKEEEKQVKTELLDVDDSKDTKKYNFKFDD